MLVKTGAATPSTGGFPDGLQAGARSRRRSGSQKKRLGRLLLGTVAPVPVGRVLRTDWISNGLKPRWKASITDRTTQIQSEDKHTNGRYYEDGEGDEKYRPNN